MCMYVSVLRVDALLARSLPPCCMQVREFAAELVPAMVANSVSTHMAPLIDEVGGAGEADTAGYLLLHTLECRARWMV